MANEFYDLFNQLFYSTDVWGYLGIGFVITVALLLSYKYHLVTPIAVVIQVLMIVSYLNLSVLTYQYHVILLFFGCIMTSLAGVYEKL